MQLLAKRVVASQLFIATKTAVRKIYRIPSVSKAAAAAAAAAAAFADMECAALAKSDRQ